MAEKHFVIKAEKDETLVISPYRLSENPNTELVLMKRVSPSPCHPDANKDKEKQYWVLQEENMLRTFYRNQDKHYFVTDVGPGKPVQVQEYLGSDTQTFTLKNGQFINRGKVLSISGGLNENARIELRPNQEAGDQFWRVEYIE